MSLRRMILASAAVATIAATPALATNLTVNGNGDPQVSQQTRVVRQHVIHHRGYNAFGRANMPNGSGWTLNSEYGQPDRW